MAAAVISAIVTVLPACGVVSRNPFLGIRTHAMLRDETAWRRGHRAAIVPTSIAAAITITLGVVFVAIGRMNDTGPVLLYAVPIVVGAVWGAVVAARAVR